MEGPRSLWGTGTREAEVTAGVPSAGSTGASNPGSPGETWRVSQETEAEKGREGNPRKTK